MKMAKIDRRKAKRLKRINEIHRLIQEYGCLTQTQLIFLTGYSQQNLSKHLGKLVSEGRIKRYYCRVIGSGKKGSTKYSSYQLFGNLGARIYYCSSEKAFIDLCLQYITSDPSSGVTSALTHHLKTMKISPEGINEIQIKRLSKGGRLRGMELKIEEALAEKLQLPKNVLYCLKIWEKLADLEEDKALKVSLKNPCDAEKLRMFLLRRNLKASRRRNMLLIWK